MSDSTDNNKGITISVTAETNTGGRRHMEDYLAVKLSPNEKLRAVPHLREQAYVGVFDGHGGKEAAKFARERLWDLIQAQPKYLENDVESVCESLREAFLALHREMEPLRATWKTNKMGDLSTAGTTASTVIFRQNYIFVANVGDSTAVLAEANPQANEPDQHPVVARVLTKDHKPDDPEETKLIERLGGRVMISRKGVPRVVWERRRNNSLQVDLIPFLSVARSLGDFWSYNPHTGNYVVSPSPDVHAQCLNVKVQKFLVIASDGLWNVMTPKEVVEFIWDYEHEDDEKLHHPRDVVKAIINEALGRWNKKHLLADNISVLIAFLSDDNSSSPSVARIESEDNNKSMPVSTTSPTPSSDTGVSMESRANPTPDDDITDSLSSTPTDSPTPIAPALSNDSPSSLSLPTLSSPLPSEEEHPSISNESSVTASTNGSPVTATINNDSGTVHCHTKMRLRHHKRNSSSKVKTFISTNIDTTESLLRQPLKREHCSQTSTTSLTKRVEQEIPTSSKRLKLDLPDSGCDCSCDKKDMEIEDDEEEIMSSDQASCGVVSSSSDSGDMFNTKRSVHDDDITESYDGESVSLALTSPVVVA